MPIKAIFLDRDGIINKDINYLHKIDECEFIDGIFDSCLFLINLGYKIIIITNQSGIARGYFTEKDFQKLNHWMLNQFKEKNIKILDVFHCPHGPDSSCFCRKPKPGMLLEAKSKYKINMKKSWMIGDSDTDILAANSAGIGNTILLVDYHSEMLTESKPDFSINSVKELKEVIKN
jgi:D-glycero-D-manno-heptose 1,7-bisphosphate phosphatase